MLNIEGCEQCDLYKGRTNIVKGRGNPKAKLVFIGEAPGEQEDLKGEAFVGPSGVLHDKMMQKAGIKKGEYYITNICRCRPPGNRDPFADEIESCIDYLWEELEEIQPKAIVLLGRISQISIFQDDFTSSHKMFGQRFDDDGVAIFCAFHPNFVRMNPEYKEQQIKIYERAAHYAREGYDIRDKIMADINSYPEDDSDSVQEEMKLFDATKVKENVVNAWSKDNTIYLLKKTSDGSLKIISRRFEHYVLMRKRDYQAVLRMDKNAFSSYTKRGLITKVKEDQNSKRWMRIYVNLTGFLSKVACEGMSYEDRPQHPGLKLFREIETDYGIKLYEADVDPPMRYLIDNNIGYYPFDKYKLLFFDIETNDEGGMDVGNMRILSISWDSPQTKEKGFDWSDSNNDKGEKDLLRRFKKVANKYDVLIAWNGDQFDFIEIIQRSEIYGIYWDVKKVMFLDHMKVFEQFYKKSEGKITSLSLDNVSQAVLGEDRGKLNIGYVCGKCKTESLEFGMCDCGGFKRKKKMMELYKEWIEEKNDILQDYNSEDVQLMIDIEEKTGLIQTLITMNYFSGIKVDIRRPSPKIDSLMLRTGFLNGVHFKTKIGQGTVDASFMGAYVLPSKAGFHEAVAVLDFASMYPSIYQTFNICPTTLIQEWQLDKYDYKDYIWTPQSLCLKKGCAYVIDEWKKDQYCPKCKNGPMHCHDVRFLRNKIGFVPVISRWTAEQRNVWRGIQKNYEIGSDEYMDCERNAYSFKQLGLCFYGDLGNPYSRYYHPELAGSITKIARFIIFKTLEWLENELGYTPVLCDTDSAYINPHVKLSDYQSLEEFCDAVKAEVDNILKKYASYIEGVLNQFNISNNKIELEFETIYSPMLIAEAKKRYAGKIVWRKGKMSDHTEIKGLEAIRSDQLPKAQLMQREIIDMILTKQKLSKIIKYIEKEREDIIYARLPIEHVVISKGLSEDTDKYYGDVIDSKTGKSKIKSDGTKQKKAIPAHVKVAEWIKEQGREFYVGMKVPYIVIGTKPRNIAIHAEDYYEAEFESLDEILTYECEAAANNSFGFDLDEYLGGYDPMYYWDRATFPCLERLLSIAFPDVNWKNYYLKQEAKLKALYYKYESRLRSVKTEKGINSSIEAAMRDENLTRDYIDSLKAFAKKRLVQIEKKKAEKKKAREAEKAAKAKKKKKESPEKKSKVFNLLFDTEETQ